MNEYLATPNSQELYFNNVYCEKIPILFGKSGSIQNSSPIGKVLFSLGLGRRRLDAKERDLDLPLFTKSTKISNEL